MSSLLSDLSVSSNKPFDSDGGMVEWRQVANEVRRSGIAAQETVVVVFVVGDVLTCSARVLASLRVATGDVEHEETVGLRTYRAGEGADCWKPR